MYITDPEFVKALKKFSLIYNPKGTATITCTIAIDNFSGQSRAFTDSSGSSLLGISFLLGQSVLGGTTSATVSTQDIDGFGKGFQLTVQQSGTNESADIIGFSVQYEQAVGSFQQETRGGDKS